MEYSVFEYTRDLRNDYTWRVKPKILPVDFSRVVQQFIYLRDKLRNNEMINWNKVGFFLKYGEVNIACQIVTNGEDYVGRTIYSLRGFVSSGNDVRAKLGIPDLINYIYMKGYTILEEEHLSLLSGNDFLVCIEDTINPLIRIDETQFIDELNCDCFRMLIEDIRTKKCNYGLIAGPDAEIIFKSISSLQISGITAFEKYYDFKLNCVVPEYKHPIVTVISAKTVEDELDKVNENTAFLYIRFYREGKLNGSYEWILQRRLDGLTIKSTKHHFVRKLPMDKLVKEEIKIRTYFSMIGFQID